MTAPRNKKGLIVVDLQYAFGPPPEQVKGIQNILSQYDIIVATQFLNQDFSLYETKLNYKKCYIGSKESELVIQMNPSSVFDRFSYGLQQPHVERLKEYPVETWDICGCDTDACVLATCYILWDNNIKFHVLKNLCHSSGGQEVHDAALRIMHRNFGE